MAGWAAGTPPGTPTLSLSTPRPNPLLPLRTEETPSDLTEELEDTPVGAVAAAVAAAASPFALPKVMEGGVEEP